MRLIVVLIAVLFSNGALGSSIDEPRCLVKNVDFWHRVYTKYDEQDALVLDADSEELVVLKRYRLPLEEVSRKNSIRSIKKRFNAESQPVRIVTGIKSKFLDGLKRDAKYRSTVEKYVKLAGLPIEISALPHVESSYNPKARSKVGAVGLWQVMPATARLYGFDSRKLRDPSYNTKAGLAVLADAYAKLGSWPLAITAYNHGLNGVMRAVRETGSTDICTIMSEYDGPRFGVSSRNFYASFLAVLRILREKGILDE